MLVPTRELSNPGRRGVPEVRARPARLPRAADLRRPELAQPFSALQRGPQVVVGTPGRIIDHLERGTLQLDAIRTLVLDEADEMLAMGFADAMEAILAQTPAEKQVALFSATMAPNIRRIAQRHLRGPREIVIRGKTGTAANIRQSYWMVSGLQSSTR